MDPHTTQRNGRSCKDCHSNPKTVGLGQGSIVFRKGEFGFVPALSNSPLLLGIEHPLDSAARMDGAMLVNSSRPFLRTFSQQEMVKILEVGLCLACHEDPKDQMMLDWLKSGRKPEKCSTFNRFIHNLFISSEKY